MEEWTRARLQKQAMSSRYLAFSDHSRTQIRETKKMVLTGFLPVLTSLREKTFVGPLIAFFIDF